MVNLPHFQRMTILLGLAPPKLNRKYERGCVRLTTPTCTQLELIYSIQAYFLKIQPLVRLRLSPTPHDAHNPPADKTQCQVWQRPHDEDKRSFETHIILAYTFAVSFYPSPPYLQVPGHEPRVVSLPSPLPRLLETRTAPILDSEYCFIKKMGEKTRSRIVTKT